MPCSSSNSLNQLFYPESVAVVGASSDPSKWGFRILHRLISSGPQAALYKEALGRAYQQDNRMRPRHLGYCGDDSDGRKIMQPVWYGTYNGALP